MPSDKPSDRPSAEETLRMLQVEPATGVSEREAQARHAQHSYDEVPEVRSKTWLMFLKKSWGVSVWERTTRCWAAGDWWARLYRMAT